MLKVEFRGIAVPVPAALPIPVTLAVEFPSPVGMAVDDAALPDDVAEPPLMVKRPE